MTTRATARPTGSRVQSIAVLIGLLVVAAAVASLGSLVNAPNIAGWYADAPKAPWNPPNWVFAPVWTTLYVVMSVSAWLVWRRRHQRVVTGALILYVTQLVLNSLWSPLFFALTPIVGIAAVWLALVVLVLLAATLVATIHEFWAIHRGAAIALVPYLAWVLFAATLNVAVGVLA